MPFKDQTLETGLLNIFFPKMEIIILSSIYKCIQ
jgi:hypothetical protein